MTDWKNVAEKMRLVASDCEADAVRVDSTPFTPLGVGTLLGEHLAMIKAVATATALVAEEFAKMEEEFRKQAGV